MNQSQMTCTACGNHVRRGDAVMRSDMHTVRTYHRDCFTVSRAIVDVEPAAVESMPLTRRLEAARAARA